MPQICLNMIVKNEAPVIERCLASVRDKIDSWVIVDTGSTDGTQDLVRSFMAGKPGALHERPWKDFAFNRNQALDLARDRADYILFIDADERLDAPAGHSWGALDADGYQLVCELGGWTYFRNALVSTRLPWRWEGVLHEYLTCLTAHAWRNLHGPVIRVARDGARARSSDTYLRDIEVLEQAIRDEPGNTRYRFYLAQSCRDAGLLRESRAHYVARAAMGGWEEECWFSRFQIAVIDERLGASPQEVAAGYLAAYQARPTRAEPLCELARYHRLRNEFALAHLYARQAAAIPCPADSLFVEAAVYEWRALDELAVSAYFANARQDGLQALTRLLEERKFPASEQARIEANKGFYGL